MVEAVTEYRGSLIRHVFEGIPTSATIPIDFNFKLEVFGKLCVDHVLRSNRYGDGYEAHIIVFQKAEPQKVKRDAESRDWYRNETHVPVDEMDRMCASWLRYRGFRVMRS